MLCGGQGGVELFGEAFAGLERRRREGSGAVRSGLQSDDGLRHADAGGDAVHHRNRDLPPEFGPWQTVYSRYRKWCREGLWQRVMEVLDS